MVRPASRVSNVLMMGPLDRRPVCAGVEVSML
jgi:hypothetical protein